MALRSFREDRGLSQRTLAAALRRSNSTVCGWERGHYEPTAQELPQVDRALGIPTGTMLGYLSGSPARRDIETFTLRSLLPPGAIDTVTVSVHEDVWINARGISQVGVEQRLHALRAGVTSYWFLYAQGAGQPRIRVVQTRGCRLGGYPRQLARGRVAQELVLDGGPMRLGEVRDFGFVIAYSNRDNPELESGLHRRVGTPTLASMKMRVIVPPGVHALVEQGTWRDRHQRPEPERVHLVRQGQKLLHWKRPNLYTYGFTYRLSS
jgi:transcriptional regulator with XRE-family HTH domain